MKTKPHLSEPLNLDTQSRRADIDSVEDSARSTRYRTRSGKDVDYTGAFKRERRRTQSPSSEKVRGCSLRVQQ